ncbi:hypothetical protein QTP88_022156 [Uroleucon formosanum]
MPVCHFFRCLRSKYSYNISGRQVELISKLYVCWTAYLLRYHGKTGHVEPVPLPGAPFSHYYATDATDEGIIMETDISVKEVSTCQCLPGEIKRLPEALSDLCVRK